MGTEPQNRRHIASLTPLQLDSASIRGYKSHRKNLKEKFPKLLLFGVERKTAFTNVQKIPSHVTIHSLSLLLGRIKRSVSYIKLYFQNCITRSPETMDVVLDFIKENRFSPDQVRYCMSSLADS